MREITIRTPNDERLFVYGIAIFLCVYFAPFETGIDLNLWERITFWTVSISVVGFMIEHCMLAILDSHWLQRLHIIFRLLLGAMIGAVPGTSFMIAISGVFRPEYMSNQIFPSLWLNVLVMSLLISGLDCLISLQLRRSKATKSSVGMPEETPDIQITEPLGAITLPRLFSRLPDKLREGQIISMSMQDHYVEITTTLGSEMLLMRLADAIDLLDGMAGAQTHRSHWAAHAHSIKMSKAGRRHEVTLSDGRVLPVSSSYKADVDAMFKTRERAYPARSLINA